MLNITERTKIFVYCPAGVVTGGAELLHQLVDLLNRNHLNAFIVYYGSGIPNIPDAYKDYNIKMALLVEDLNDNVVVFYEAVFDRLKSVNRAQILLWWLSVDNFFLFGGEHLKLSDIVRFDFFFGFKVFSYRLYQLIFRRKNLFKNLISIKWLSEIDAINAYQSEYAQNFLINNAFKLTVPLSDYINTDFYSGSPLIKSSNTILYNPKKGLEFTEKIIKRLPDYEWIPLQNMSREQLVKVFAESKLYIDFGYHPGKDRLPREAALNGCCVITGIKGSARYFEDVPIINKYKFEQSDSSVDSIIQMINTLMADYESHTKDFDFYRAQILREKNQFESQAKLIFNIK